jgi:hypothetical protein
MHFCKAVHVARFVVIARQNLVHAGAVPEEVLGELPADLLLGDVDQVALHGVVEVVCADDLAVEQRALGVAHLPRALLVDQQPAAQGLGVDLEEAGELGDVHGGVELEVRAHGRREHVVLDLLHEDRQVVLDRVDVEGWVVEVRRRRGDELGAGGAEELLEDGQGLGAAALHAGELVAVLLAQGGVDGVVEARGVEGHADGDEGVHLVALLGDAVVLGALLEVLGARDVDEDVVEGAQGVGVAVHHHVAEADVVVGREVGGGDTREHGLLVELDVVERLERQGEVTEQAVHAQQTHDREVAQHLVQRPSAVLAHVGSGVLVALAGGQLLADLRSLDQRVEDVEHGVAAPGVGVLAQNGEILFGRLLERDLCAVGAEGLELVDELVDDVPGPERRRHLDVDGALAVEDEVEQVAVLVVALDLGVDCGLVLERLRGGGELCLQVLRSTSERVGALEVVVLALVVVAGGLAVVVGEGLLLDVRVIVDWSLRLGLLVSGCLADRHDGRCVGVSGGLSSSEILRCSIVDVVVAVWYNFADQIDAKRRGLGVHVP